MLCDYCDGTIAPTEHTAGFAMHMEAGLSLAACYRCCAWLAIIDMRAGKDPGLYVDDNGQHVSIWPGTLILAVTRKRTGRHNLAGSRTTYHFEGPDGTTWTGTEYHGPASGNLLRGVRPLKGR